MFQSLFEWRHACGWWTSSCLATDTCARIFLSGSIWWNESNLPSVEHPPSPPTACRTEHSGEQKGVRLLTLPDRAVGWAEGACAYYPPQPPPPQCVGQSIRVSRRGVRLLSPQPPPPHSVWDRAFGWTEGACAYYPPPAPSPPQCVGQSLRVSRRVLRLFTDTDYSLRARLGMVALNDGVEEFTLSLR